MRVDDRGRVLDQQPRRTTGHPRGRRPAPRAAWPARRRARFARRHRARRGRLERPYRDRATGAAGGGHNRPRRQRVAVHDEESTCATGGCRSRSSRPSSWARPHPPQPRGELGRRCRARRPRGRPRRPGAAVRRSPRRSRAARRDRGRGAASTGRRARHAGRGHGAVPSARRCWRRARTSIVARPNYATNVETPRAIGADVTFLDLAYEDGWAVDPDRIATLLRPETPALSLTTPHNPTGTTLDRATLDAVVALVERHGTARLLVDETYREMTFASRSPSRRRCRTGCLRVQPVEDLRPAGHPRRVARDARPGLAEQLLAAKEQVLISGSLVDETIALAALRRRPDLAARHPRGIATAFASSAAWLEGQPDASSGCRPGAASSGFPRVRAEDGGALRPRPLLPAAVRAPRHRRRARPLVRAAADRTSGWATAGRRPTSCAAGSRPSMRPSTRPSADRRRSG